MLVGDRVLEELLPELEGLTEHPVAAGIADRVLLMGRSCDGREAHFPEAECFSEMPINPRHVDRFRGQRHAGTYRTGSVPSQQLLDLRRHDLVAAGAVV